MNSIFIFVKLFENFFGLFSFSRLNFLLIICPSVSRGNGFEPLLALGIVAGFRVSFFRCICYRRLINFKTENTCIPFQAKRAYNKIKN